MQHFRLNLRYDLELTGFKLMGQTGVTFCCYVAVLPQLVVDSRPKTPDNPVRNDAKVHA